MGGLYDDGQWRRLPFFQEGFLFVFFLFFQYHFSKFHYHTQIFHPRHTTPSFILIFIGFRTTTATTPLSRVFFILFDHNGCPPLGRFILFRRWRTWTPEQLLPILYIYPSCFFFTRGVLFYFFNFWVFDDHFDWFLIARIPSLMSPREKI